MELQNQIIIEKHGTVTLFDIKGGVTSTSESCFREAYGNPDIQKTERILLVFDKDAYINSGGIAVLIQLLAETKRNEQTIAITGLSDHFRKIFNMVGITKFAQSYGSVEEGLEGLSGS
jgi:anti-anti-sigma factor